MANMTAKPSKPDRRPLRVIVVDDESAVADMLAEVVRYAGHEVIAMARDGMEAVTTVRQHQPDVVIMDVLMPRLNGVQAMRQIVAARAARKVLLVSGEYRSLGMTRDQIVKEGAAGFLEKPFSVTELSNLLDQWAIELTDAGDQPANSPVS